MSRSRKVSGVPRIAMVPMIPLVLSLLNGCASATMGVGGAAPSMSNVRLDARLLSMTDQRQADTALIDTLLADRDNDRRARTALAIGQLKVRARFPQLRQLLLDADTAIAANAAYALGIARDTGAVVALARAMAGAPDAVAREAAWSLGEIGEPARTVLSVALGEGQARPLATSALALRAPAVRAAAVLATVKLRPAPIALISPFLADSAHEVVTAAAYVIGRLRAPAGVRAVLAVRDHPNEEVRQHVARALTRTTVGDSLAAPAIEALRTLMRDRSERVRENAVRSAATFGPRLADEITPLLHDSIANVRVSAAENLADVFARDSARWREAWAADTLLTVRRLLLQQVRRLGLALFTDAERTWAANADWRYRVAALGEAGANAPKPDTALARRLLGDADPRVQRTARARLGMRDSAAARTPRSTVPVPRPIEEYEQLVRRFLATGARPPRAYIETERGTVIIELFAREAPLVVEAFMRLAENGTYRNTTFHRVVPNFVVQDGDATGDGSGEAGFTLRESWTRKRHDRGCVGLATAGPDTGGSQYYLCHSPQPHLDGAYTVFGRVLDGFDVMDRIVQGDRMLRIRVR
jgi:cyclophilin family peptidyl-prolyl cis-trans isomerase/HEAT repeat protein